MKKRPLILCTIALAAAGLLAGCSQEAGQEETQERTDGANQAGSMSSTFITPIEEITELENGLSVVRYEGNYGFEGFLEQGGADSDAV